MLNMDTRSVYYLPQKCKIGYDVMTQMTMKALAMATAISLGGYDINTSWLTFEPNVRKPQTPDQTQNTAKHERSYLWQHHKIADFCYQRNLNWNIKTHYMMNFRNDNWFAACTDVLCLGNVIEIKHVLTSSFLNVIKIQYMQDSLTGYSE